MVTSKNLTFLAERASDETLYSQCARFHSRSGYETPNLTGQLLFNDSQAGRYAQLPFGLSHFITCNFSSLSPLQLLRQQTISNLYLAFMPEREIVEFTSGRVAHRISVLDTKRGLFGHKDFLCHPLKFCPDCIALDIREKGFSYWHLAHQIPGIWICARHGTLLVKRIRTSAERDNWLRPPTSYPPQSRDHPLLAKETKSLLLRLAAAIQWISEQRGLTADRLRMMLMQNYETSDDLRFQQLLSSAHTYFYDGLKILGIDELDALGLFTRRWYSQHEPPVLHPVQWAAAIAYCVPRDTWDEALIHTYEDSSGELFNSAEVSPSKELNADDQLNIAILAMTLNISQTAPMLRESYQRNLFMLSGSTGAMALHANAVREGKRLRYRYLAMQALFTDTPTLSLRETKEAIAWIVEHDGEWLALSKSDVHKVMRQLTLFPSP
ncbi:TniQ family protein [Herbaspirillum rubrisubalbicans]|nr:TniQ family protein [Herbaspirillum rubrisubalbicans]